MRNFVAASCCLIVGLEILVGVPVAVCLGFFCIGSELTGAYVVESQGPVPMYAAATYVPSQPPSYSEPIACAAPSQSVPTFDPYAAAPSRPGLCPAPTSSSAPQNRSGGTIPASAPTDDLVTAEEKESNSAAAPLLDEPLPEAATEVVVEASQPIQGAGQSFWLSIGDAHQLLARVCSGDDCPQQAAGHSEAAAGSVDRALLDSMRQTSRLLYQQADRREEEGGYDTADSLRNLARQLRTYADDISASVRDEQRVTTAPSAVTVGPPPRG